MLKKFLILVLCILVFQTVSFTQNDNISKNLLSRTERAVDFSALQELTGSVFLRAEGLESSKKPKAVVRLCSNESIELAMLKSALSFPAILENFAGLGFSGDNLIILKSPDCASKRDVTVATEIYAIPPKDALPPHTEKYTSDQITVEIINQTYSRYIGTSAYLKNAKKLVKALKNDSSAQGIVFGVYCRKPSEIDGILKKVSTLFQKSEINEFQYKVQKLKWENHTCIKSGSKERSFPSFFLVKIKRIKFGAAVGDPYPSGTPDPNYPECDYDHDGEEHDDCEIPGYEDPDNEDSEIGSVRENTCYVDGFERDCNEVAAHPDHYGSDDVDLDGSYKEEKAPSEEGPLGVWDDDDQSYQHEQIHKAEVKKFEQHYSGMNVSFGENAGVGVEIRMPGPRFSTWDLRRETSQQNDKRSASRSVDDWRSPFHFFSSDEKLSGEDCDSKMSKIFGGVAKAMEGAGDITRVNRISKTGSSHTATPGTNPYIVDHDGKRVRNPDNGGIIHTYTDEQGSLREDIPLFAPGGWTSASTYFTGGNSGVILNYGSITIEFVHAGTDNKNGNPSKPINPGKGNLAQIGFVGGAGGDTGALHPLYANGERVGKIGYTHTHIVFFSNKANNERIDPRKIFCGW